jgi:hypothetical protein
VRADGEASVLKYLSSAPTFENVLLDVVVVVPPRSWNDVPNSERANSNWKRTISNHQVHVYIVHVSISSFFAMSRFIDFESTEDNDLLSEDEINVDVEVKVADEPIIQPVVTVATTLLSTKVNAMLQNAFINGMFFKETTRFSLGLTSHDSGTSKIFPVVFTTEEDPTKRNSFACLLRATTVRGKRVEQTDRTREAQPHT